MERLRERDFRSALDFLGEIDSRDLASFRASVIAGLPRLVACDVATYDEINPATGEVMWITQPREHAILADDEAFLRNIDEHPVVRHHRTRDGGARTLSDFYSRRRWHATSLYNEFFRPLDLETQVAMLFYGPSPVIVGTSLNRERGDPSERDRLVLDLVRPHLGRAFESALARERNDRMLAALETGADHVGTGVLVLTPDRRIAGASACARQRLADFFGPAVSTDRLPDDLDGWVSAQRGDAAPGGVLRGQREERVLTIRFVPREAPAEPDVLLLEEVNSAPTPEDLRSLGLTRRESEVLALIAAGRSNREIANALVISPLTAKKHAENIYAKLGVRGRAAAAARAQRAASAPIL